MSMKFFLVNVTIILKSPVAMPALLLINDTLVTSTNFAKKNPKWSSVMYNGTPYKVTIVFLVSMYSICNRTDFVVRLFGARDLAASSVGSRMSHMAILLRANTLALINFFYLLEIAPTKLENKT